MTDLKLTRAEFDSFTDEEKYRAYISVVNGLEELCESSQAAMQEAAHIVEKGVAGILSRVQ
jgi:hypothetical protein